MNIDGSGLHRVTSGGGIDREPEWSPDGKQLAFVRLANQTDYAGDIYIVNADGSGLRKLTSGGEPSWSPDGTRLLYYAPPGTGSDALSIADGSLRMIQADGTNDHLVAPGLGDGTWMPDGVTIFAGGVSLDSSITNVYRLRADGTGQTRLTDDPTFACSPAAAPDGSSVAFINSAGPNPIHVSLMNTDGSEQRAITSGTEWDSYPSWSPDSKRIVFSRDPDGDPHWSPPVINGPANASLYLINPDGTGLSRLTDGSYDDVDPAFRPGSAR